MSVHGRTNGFDPVHTRLVDFPSGHLWEKTRITWTRRTPLLPKRRENTHQDEAMKAWFSGEPDLWVTQDTYSGTWYRMWNDEHRRGRFEVIG